MDWAENKMKALGIETQQVDIGNQTLPDGSVLKLPNVILGSLGNVSNEIIIIINTGVNLIKLVIVQYNIIFSYLFFSIHNSTFFFYNT